MTLQVVAPKARPDPYLNIREAMASALEVMAAGVESVRGVIVGRLSGPAKDAALAEFSPLLTAANFATAAAGTLRDFGPDDDPYEMFDALEHGTMSVANMTMLLRVIETWR